MPAAMNLDLALDRVYAVPLDEFTAERNRLAKELADVGEDAGAATVKAIKKPSVSAWAINQLARRRRDEVTALVELHEELAGAGDAKSLRRVQEERRRLISALTDGAEEVLAGSGHSAASGTLQRVSQTLLAASDGADLEALQRGRLTHDLEPSGFGALSGFELAADSEPFRKDEKRAHDEAEELARRATEAERDASDARRAAEAATAEAARLEKAADKAEKRAESAREKADRALDRLG